MSDHLDMKEMKRFGFALWSYKMGEQVALMIHLGDRLGAYKAMQGAGPQTSVELAAILGLNERMLREWLMGQAAARLINRHDDGRFELSPVQAAFLADEAGSISFAAGAFRGGIDPTTVDALASSFRTGIGVTYEQQGTAAAAGLARMTGPWSRLALTSAILPALDGVVEKLEAGATVIDIGCGAGVTLATIGATFPNSTCTGYDPSSSALALAREHVADAGLDNVSFVEAPAEVLPPDLDADLVICFDCLHDMPFPDRAASAIRSTIADDGTWLIKDIRSTGSFEQDSKNPLLAMFYGFSVASCLQSAMSEPGGMGLGTLGLHPQRAEELVREAGFNSFITHDLDDAANLYYEVKVDE
ncbi:MAG: methyltransferase domain-containing protein [Actinomycetia bacterium]|nr:methyltransferase domain-containing protein [Actinomycetes bacterium]MCP4227664.1 methyltransferase domain-containing protein [Actinomycetes bacterium]MCP5034758.1 methyltransferase domain-containing protein [Actinomycetes bacterium]